MDWELPAVSDIAEAGYSLPGQLSNEADQKTGPLDVLAQGGWVIRGRGQWNMPGPGPGRRPVPAPAAVRRLLTGTAAAGARSCRAVPVASAWCLKGAVPTPGYDIRERSSH